MGCQKTVNLLDNTPNQPTRFKIENRFQINDESRGTRLKLDSKNLIVKM